ncbi:uncharacterized protein LOC121981315 [Zingiber officinale]|uniref:PLATZ transcription factor family protein n=1 Tax=Zingiber officinale TaxID=94328 RepID=A0A8J5GHS2_ZINOF|nr:uncharacterized protein LOC121981315 [Zingiber officinale]KAG6507731.1 hypothetical protein ZIOFF_033082 [Zingiber officinale]
MEGGKKNGKKKTEMTATGRSTNEGGFLAFNASFNPLSFSTSSLRYSVREVYKRTPFLASLTLLLSFPIHSAPLLWMIQVAVNQDSPFKELGIKNRGGMGMEQGGGGREEHRWPPWLRPLLSTSFFVQCKKHAVHSHRSECNMYCLDCTDGALCSVCVLAHRDHHAIQIRRSSYHDVIRVSEIQKVLDISGVQTYIINSARVVFLNERPQPRPGKGVTRTCEVCDRSLVDSFRFCSLGCKLSGTSYNDDNHNKKIKSRGGSDSEHSSTSEKSNAIQNFTPSTPPPSSAKRRKGIPHRAPFGSVMLEF